MTEVVVDVQQSIVNAVQLECQGFRFTMPVKVSHLGLFVSGGKRKNRSGTVFANELGEDEWKKWRKVVDKLHYVIFRCGVPHPATPGDPSLYESLNASLLWLKRDGFTIDSVSNVGNAKDGVGGGTRLEGDLKSRIVDVRAARLRGSLQKGNANTPLIPTRLLLISLSLSSYHPSTHESPGIQETDETKPPELRHSDQNEEISYRWIPEEQEEGGSDGGQDPMHHVCPAGRVCLHSHVSRS